MNESKYLLLVPTDETRKIMKNDKILWSKIKDIIVQKLILYMIMMKNIWESNLSQLMTYF